MHIHINTYNIYERVCEFSFVQNQHHLPDLPDRTPPGDPGTGPGLGSGVRDNGPTAPDACQTMAGIYHRNRHSERLLIEQSWKFHAKLRACSPSPSPSLAFVVFLTISYVPYEKFSIFLPWSHVCTQRQMCQTHGNVSNDNVTSFLCMYYINHTVPYHIIS